MSSWKEIGLKMKVHWRYIIHSISHTFFFLSWFDLIVGFWEVQSGFRRLEDFPMPFWLALFVEGTRFTQPKLVAAQRYAASRGLPVPRNVLIPRTKVEFWCRKFKLCFVETELFNFFFFLVFLCSLPNGANRVLCRRWLICVPLSPQFTIARWPFPRTILFLHCWDYSEGKLLW